MKREIKCVTAVVVFFAMMSAVQAQRGFNRYYRTHASHEFAYNYRTPYSTLNRSRYNAYGRPVIVNRGPSVLGPRYYSIPHNSISITFGGNPYFYSGGHFYRPFGGYYRSVFPPVGIRIGILPVGFLSFYVGAQPFFFYNGIYYRRYDDRSYEVIDAPIGAQLPYLPEGAKAVTVNEEKFYELNGSYYKEDRNEKGQTVFTVVGKNGHINNTEDAPEADALALPKTGDKVTELPGNCKTVIINEQKLYVSPDNNYYQPNNDGTYTIVGTATGPGQ